MPRPVRKELNSLLLKVGPLEFSLNAFTEFAEFSDKKNI